MRYKKRSRESFFFAGLLKAARCIIPTIELSTKKLKGKLALNTIYFDGMRV